MSNDLSYSAFESRFRNKQYIGSGGFAKVYKVFDHAKNHYVALKVADVRPELKKFTLKNEVELVNKLPYHRNIARYDSCYRYNTGFTGEMDFAVLQFYEYGNLEQFLKKEKITLEDKRLIIQSILRGISFLHSNNVIHRDLKSQNILLHREDGVWTPKITDFGLSRVVSDEASLLNSSIGHTVSYAAPEQIRNKKIFKNVDIWSVGVIIYRIIAGELPFKGRSDGDDKSTNSQLELSKKIVTLDLPEKLETIPQPYRSMIKRCLVLDQNERAQTADELMAILNTDAESIVDPVVNKPVTIAEDKTDHISSLREVTHNPVQPPVLSDSDLKIRSTVMPDSGTTQPDGKAPASPPSYQTPKSYQAPKSYAKPESNVTQIIDHGKRTAIKEPEPVTKYQPKTGGGSKKFNLAYVLVPLLLGAVGFGVWYFMNNQPATAKVDVTSGGTISLFEEDAVGGSNSLWFKEMHARINVGWQDAQELKNIQKDIISNLNRDNSADFKPFFKLAESLASHNGGEDLTLTVLEKALETATAYDQASIMLTEIKAADGSQMQELLNARDWKRISRALQKAERLQQ